MDLGVSLLTPNLRGNAWMNPFALWDLQSLIRHLREERGVNRFLLVSGSMGGTGSLIYACLNPSDITGVVAVCPATDIHQYWQWCNSQPDNARLQPIERAIYKGYAHTPYEMTLHAVLPQAHQLTMPVYIAHGDDDRIIPVEQSRQLAAVLKDKLDFKYVEQPGGHHDSPLSLMPEGLDWVMGQID